MSKRAWIRRPPTIIAITIAAICLMVQGAAADDLPGIAQYPCHITGSGYTCTGGCGTAGAVITINSTSSSANAQTFFDWDGDVTTTNNIPGNDTYHSTLNVNTAQDFDVPEFPETSPTTHVGAMTPVVIGQRVDVGIIFGAVQAQIRNCLRS